MVKLSHAASAAENIMHSLVPKSRIEAELICAFVLKKDRLYIKFHPNDDISDADFELIKSLSHQRSCGKPLAYITGSKEFMSLEFAVNEDVLIPRPETEELCELIIEKAKGDNANILDLCTGSGAIACSLAKYLPHSKAVGVDISDKAIAVARQNSKKLGLIDRVSFVKGDALQNIAFKEKFDIVVSNPPYIETKIIQGLENTVKDFEPTLALDGGEDGLMFYRAIAKNAIGYLKKDGMLYFEIGYNQGKAVTDLLCDNFKNIKLIKDYSDKDRIVSAQLA